jgi:hypothetical protein
MSNRITVVTNPPWSAVEVRGLSGSGVEIIGVMVEFYPSRPPLTDASGTICGIQGGKLGGMNAGGHLGVADIARVVNRMYPVFPLPILRRSLSHRDLHSSYARTSRI